MIERHWKGVAKQPEADAYIHHLLTATFPSLQMIDGFIEASILKRQVKTGIEFLVVTKWTSLDAIRQFAGEQPDVAVVPETVKRMMLSFDSHVSHYEVAGGVKN